MHLGDRLGRNFLKRPNAACLSARLVVSQDPARREKERKLVVALFGGWKVSDRVKPRASVGRRKAIGEQTWRAAMVRGGTGPEDAVLRVDSLVRDAGIVGRAAAAGPTELFEHILGAGE